MCLAFDKSSGTKPIRTCNYVQKVCKKAHHVPFTALTDCFIQTLYKCIGYLNNIAGI